MMRALIYRLRLAWQAWTGEPSTWDQVVARSIRDATDRGWPSGRRD